MTLFNATEGNIREAAGVRKVEGEIVAREYTSSIGVTATVGLSLSPADARRFARQLMRLAERIERRLAAEAELPDTGTQPK